MRCSLSRTLSEQLFLSFAYKDFVRPYEVPWKPSMIVYEIYSFLSVGMGYQPYLASKPTGLVSSLRSRTFKYPDPMG